MDENIKRKKGLPLDLERETYEALCPIFDKYLQMKKRHMSHDRIIGIMYYALILLSKGTRKDNREEGAK